MKKNSIALLMTALILALFFIGQVHAQTRLVFDTNGNILGSFVEGSAEANVARTAAIYNRAGGAGTVVGSSLSNGVVTLQRAATLEIGAGSGLGTAVKIAVTDVIKSPVASLGKGVLGVARLTPTGLVGTVAGTILLDAGISYLNGQWNKAGSLEQAPNGKPFSSTGGYLSSADVTVRGDPDYVCAYQVGKTANGPWTYTGWSLGSGNTRYCNMKRASDGFVFQTLLQWTPSGCPSGYAVSNGMCIPPGYVAPSDSAPATDSQIADAITNGLTASPARVGDVVKSIEAGGGFMVVDMSDGASFGIPTDTVTGKPTKSVTQSPGADGSPLTSTTTNTPTARISQSGGTVAGNTINYSITNVTSTVVTNAAGQVVSTSTGSETPDVTFTDSGMPDQPKLYTQKYPDGIAGVWRDNKPDIKSTQFWQGVQTMFPSFGSGSCPVWRMNLNVASWANFGSGDITVPCWIFQALGLVMMATAAFTARKILF